MPILLGLYWLADHYHRIILVPLLLGASIVFYAWWSVPYLLLLSISISANYLLGSYILSNKNVSNNLALRLGIIFNISLLVYYKYTNFFVDQANELFGANFTNESILLPLAISFFTFQQIAYLVDCSRGNARKSDFLNYALFVSFFPQLIAGPIVRAQEMLPQIMAIKKKANISAENLSIGVTLFVIGLFKKVILADSLAVYATPIFDGADHGAYVSSGEAWIGSLAYTFQLYFDFSGYSDMAIGLARMFGFRLPINFISPYKATSIIQFWKSWHITLSSFLQEYLYIPLGGNRHGAWRKSINLMITMFLGGIWHGAGWTFIVWGLLHGIYLVINHAWRSLTKPYLQLAHRIRPNFIYKTIVWAITFISIVVAWVVFRAHTIDGAILMLRAMFGIDGFSLPNDYAMIFPFLVNPLEAVGVDFYGYQLIWRLPLVGIGQLLLASFLIVLLLPNNAQIFSLLENNNRKSSLLVFKANYVWLVATLGLFISALFGMTEVSEFLYYQF